MILILNYTFLISVLFLRVKVYRLTANRYKYYFEKRHIQFPLHLIEYLQIEVVSKHKLCAIMICIFYTLYQYFSTYRRAVRKETRTKQNGDT